MIVIPAEKLSGLCQHDDALPIHFRCLDDGDAYSAIGARDSIGAVRGSVSVRTGPDVDVTQVGDPRDEVRIIITCPRDGECAQPVSEPSGREWNAAGHVKRNGVWHTVPVSVVPVRQDLYSRTRSIFETDVLTDKCVCVAGQGSGGALISLELAKAGVNQILIDHDRLEVVNVVRHVAGLADVGRYKTKVVAEMIRGKNPYARVDTYEAKISWETEGLVRAVAQRSDLVVCAVDDDEARAAINNICVDEGTPLIVAGCFRRAHGGMVLMIRPGETLCYQCFHHAMPEQVRDWEVSSRRQAEQMAYTDRPVPIEPGLSTDIAPVSLMVVKLAIQHLLKGTQTTLRSLDEDLAASAYLWLNRREAGTDYERLEPMRFNVDGLHVLRWYGLAVERDPACPCCGDFVARRAQEEGIEITPEGVAAFTEDSNS